jgi:hypothetical protein
MNRLSRVAIPILLLSTNFQFVSADITSPYVLDEKPQVLFGDSAEIAATSTDGNPVTYKGLENYAHDYVNNYLHLTFTYTHDRGSFSSYPPRLYITAEDSISTTSPAVRDEQAVYELQVFWAGQGHETDWYSYDVQFDATGYQVNVLQGGATSTASFHTDVAGLADTDWAALANLYPGVNDFSMAFAPLPIYETPAAPVATTTPVIIVPGIMGTELIDTNLVDNLIWPNAIKIAVDPLDLFLDDLRMTEDGTSQNETITTRDIVRKSGDSNFWEDLVNNLSSAKYIEGEDLFVFPYDWRLDVRTTATLLQNKIEEVKAARGVDKVDLIAHSMGGLLVKEYIKQYSGSNIDKYIDLGTPNQGSPSSFMTLMYGDNLGVKYLKGIVSLSSGKIKEISQNMPSVYELLPSERYFDSDPSYVFDGPNGNRRLTYAETNDYLKSAGRNAALVDRANAFHQEIDGLNPAAYGVETYNIVGCGTPTIGKFYILQEGDHPIVNLGYVTGDGTVPLASATALPAAHTYYLHGAKHALMPSASGVKELVAGILTATSSDEFDISPYASLSLDESGCSLPNGRVVSLHSPIDLHIYDSSGNHAGPDANGDIENNIEGVEYDVVDGNKFAYLPTGIEYAIKGSATGEGTFDLRIQEVVGGEVATTTLFADVPITPVSQLEFALGVAVPQQITLDEDDDGVFERVVDVSTSTPGVLESTGKATTAPVAEPAVEEIVGSSRAHGQKKEVVATTTASTTPLLALASTTSVGATSTPLLVPQVVKTKPVIEAPIATSTPEGTTSPVENTAIVYKSVPTKLKLLLRGVWGWIKSKI